jgi:hypothetical protein
MTTVTNAQLIELVEAFASLALRLGRNLGTVGPVDSGERCTIAEINLVLTGTLSDDPHPCISEVIRRWVIAVQDAMPDELRNSPAWRTSAPLIAGTATENGGVERKRRDAIVAWMWDRLADEAVLASLPDAVRPAWDRMLAERTPAAAVTAARDAVGYRLGVHEAAVHAAFATAATPRRAATHAAYAADAAAYAVRSDGRQAHGFYWHRANPAGLLALLVAIRQEGS